MRILLILLFISFNSLGQTYDDIMSINSLDVFKKVAIENGYEYIAFEELFSTQSIEVDDSTRNVIENFVMYSYKNTPRTLTYDKRDDSFTFAYPNELLELFKESPYKLIADDIKKNCKYYKIIIHNDIEYVTYSCSQSSYKGKIGFALKEEIGFIRHFANE